MQTKHAGFFVSCSIFLFVLKPRNYIAFKALQNRLPTEKATSLLYKLHVPWKEKAFPSGFVFPAYWNCSCLHLKVLRTLPKHCSTTSVYTIKINTCYKGNSMWQTEKPAHVWAAIKHLAGKEWGKRQQWRDTARWNTLLSFHKCAAFTKGFLKFLQRV